MEHWIQYFNFRKLEEEGKPTRYFIIVDNGFVEVSEEIYRAYTIDTHKMKYTEIDLKSKRPLKNSRTGRVIRDENGQTIMLSEREESLENLVSENMVFKSTAPSPAEETFQNLELHQLRCALALLNENERQLIIAIFYEGLSLRKYALRIGVSKNTVDRRKTKILAFLRENLDS